MQITIQISDQQSDNTITEHEALVLLAEKAGCTPEQLHDTIFLNNYE